MHSATLAARMAVSLAASQRAALIALVAASCLTVAACSPGADYPSLFPAVHDIPPPRADATLDANQVQQATEDLISARDRLSAEAQGAESKNSAGSSKPAANSASKSSAKPATAPAATKRQPSSQLSGRQGPGTDAAQTAGAETK